MADIESRVSTLEQKIEMIEGAIASLNALPETPFSPVNDNVFSVGPARPGLQRVPSEGGFGAPPMMRQGSGGSILGNNQPITPRRGGRRSRRRKNKKGLKRRKTQHRKRA